MKQTLLACLLTTMACSPSEGTDTDTDTDESPANSDTCELATEMECEDDLFLDLGLQESGVYDWGGTANTASGNGWVTEIDATAGGMPNAPTSPWLYLKFTETGLEPVALTDVEALSSGEWHLAAKRFQIRLNGGNSGPSCVSAVALASEAYEDVAAIEGEFNGVEDNFYSKTCEFVPDGSGLGDSPLLALSAWWQYPGCVATTGIPFVIRLADGQQVKFVVDEYYAEGQETCNTAGTMGSGSANLSARWELL